MDANRARRERDAAAFAARYRQALSAYVAESDESALARGYELGRECLASGRTIPEIVELHNRAVQRLLPRGRAPAAIRAVIDAAAAFLAETLSPFEMTHRGYRDSLIAWRHINETLEQEIARIAHALHDESGQLLVSIHLQLAQLARELPAAGSKVHDCQTLLTRAEQELRQLSHELRPVVLDDLGWLAAIEFLATAISRRSQVHVEVRSNVTRRLQPAVEIALYRVVQEALTNAIRHAHARHIRVEIDQDREGVHCLIGDDGVGFKVDSTARHDGLGLRGMRERLSALGGSLQIASAAGRGSQIRLQLPTES